MSVYFKACESSRALATTERINVELYMYLLAYPSCCSNKGERRSKVGKNNGNVKDVQSSSSSAPSNECEPDSISAPERAPHFSFSIVVCSGSAASSTSCDIVGSSAELTACVPHEANDPTTRFSTAKNMPLHSRYPDRAHW